jgi:hypothetical protein
LAFHRDPLRRLLVGEVTEHCRYDEDRPSECGLAYSSGSVDVGVESDPRDHRGAGRDECREPDGDQKATGHTLSVAGGVKPPAPQPHVPVAQITVACL